jgi:hypothetical protein
MTNYPTLDPTTNVTFGGALGLKLLASGFSQQLVELAWLNVMVPTSIEMQPAIYTESALVISYR